MPTWVEVVQTGGMVALLLLFLYGFKAEWWVIGQTHHRKVEEAREARLALDAYRDKVEERVIPLLGETTRAAAQLAELERSRRLDS